MDSSKVAEASTKFQSIYKSHPTSLSGGKRRRHTSTHRQYTHRNKRNRYSRRYKRSGRNKRNRYSRRYKGGGGNVLANTPYTPSFSIGSKLIPQHSAEANPPPIVATNNCQNIPRS